VSTASALVRGFRWRPPTVISADATANPVDAASIEKTRERPRNRHPSSKPHAANRAKAPLAHGHGPLGRRSRAQLELAR